MVGNNTPVFFFRDPLRFSDLNHTIKRDPRTGLRSADNNWDFWSLLPEALHQVTIVMSDRGLPKSFRHMHGFGSHNFSMINAANERSWASFISVPSRALGISPIRKRLIWSAGTARATAAISSRQSNAEGHVIARHRQLWPITSKRSLVSNSSYAGFAR
ncbi:hypothetical protein V1280_003419 [Bradyrhizobium sp. AZCC 2230]